MSSFHPPFIEEPKLAIMCPRTGQRNIGNAAVSSAAFTASFGLGLPISPAGSTQLAVWWGIFVAVIPPDGFAAVGGTVAGVGPGARTKPSL